jgi:hypothetical protein
LNIANDDRLLARIVEAVAGVPGIRAVVLGGSRACGTATAHSDYDIGLYYDPQAPFDHGALSRVVARLDDAGPAAQVTTIGGWGPWIDGGGWLTISGTRVDLLYRNLDRVQAVIDDCHAGKIEVAYQPGHPHAFVSAIYMGEVACCRPQWDPEGVLVRLAARTTPYPPRLRAALLQRFQWEAGFALANARKSLDRGDVAYVAGCAFRAAACLCQVLFALNGRYMLNEKGAPAGVDSLALRPQEFGARVTAAFRDIGAGKAAAALDAFQAMVDETNTLARM